MSKRKTSLLGDSRRDRRLLIPLALLATVLLAVVAIAAYGRPLGKGSGSSGGLPLSFWSRVSCCSSRSESRLGSRAAGRPRSAPRDHRVKRSVDFSSASGLAKGLAGMRAGVMRLAHFHPPSSDGPAFRDLLAKLRDINARLDGHRATLLRLERRLKAPSEGSATPTIERFRALVVPLASDGLRAAADARALWLGVCATDFSGGAPFESSPGGRPT